MRRGVMVAAAVAALETAGRSVELWACVCAAAGGTHNVLATMARVCVKRAGQPLNLGEVAFACAHPGMLRRLGFAWYDHCYRDKGIQVGQGNSYGFPADPPKDMQGDVMAPSITQDHTPTDDEVLAWVRDVLKAQGIETSIN